MNVIRREIKKGCRYCKFYEIFSILGKKTLHESMNEIGDWLLDTDNTLKQSIPSVIPLLVPKGEYCEIILYLRRWFNNGSILDDLTVEILKHVLREYDNTASGQQRPDLNFIIDAKYLLVELVEKKQIKTGFFKNKYKGNEYLQCGALIYAFENYCTDLDYDKICEKLNKLSHLKTVVEQWIQEKKNENNRTNGLLRSLNNSNDAYLHNIDCALKKIINYKYKNKSIFSTTKWSSKLKNDEQANDTLGEICLAKLLIEKSYRIKELEAKVDGKDFDLLVEINSKQLYIDVIRLKEFLPLDYFGGPQYISSTWLSNKIKRKYCNKFLALHDDDIAILAIDNSQGAVDIEEVERAFDCNMCLMRAVLLFDQSSVCLICNPNAPLPNEFREKLLGLTQCNSQQYQ